MQGLVPRFCCENLLRTIQTRRGPASDQVVDQPAAISADTTLVARLGKEAVGAGGGPYRGGSQYVRERLKDAILRVDDSGAVNGRCISAWSRRLNRAATARWAQEPGLRPCAIAGAAALGIATSLGMGAGIA